MIAGETGCVRTHEKGCARAVRMDFSFLNYCNGADTKGEGEGWGTWRGHSFLRGEEG